MVYFFITLTINIHIKLEKCVPEKKIANAIIALRKHTLNGAVAQYA